MADYIGYSDLDLVEQYKKGDPKAFDELFHRYKTKLVRAIVRFTGDPQASEEIAHEVLLEVYQHIDRFRGQSKLFTYLYGMAHHKSIDYLRKRSRRREVALEEGGEGEEGRSTEERGKHWESKLESPREIHDKKELSQLLQQALNQLPNIARQAFILTEIEEFSYEETAKSLGISTGTVGWHVHDARKRLRKLLPLEMLEIFFFRAGWIYEEAYYGMGIMIENAKLALGMPSSLLLSYYLDGEVSQWQRQQIDSILKTNPRFKQEFEDYGKIQTLYGQMEVPELSPDFDLEFERKLREITTDDRGPQTDDRRPTIEDFAGRLSTVVRRLSLVLRPLLIPVLAVFIAVFGYLFSYPLIQGSPLSITYLYGAVEIFDARTSSWIPAARGLKIREGLRMRTGQGASTDLILAGQLAMRIKENSEVDFGILFRSRQNGQMTISQKQGKTLVGLGPKFKGSRFTVNTPYGSAHAYGTLFLVEVLPQNQMTRVMTLEGTVEVEDIRKTLQTAIPETERVLRPEKIEEPTPLAADRQPEVEELQKLPVPGGVTKISSLLEENLDLMLATGPARVKEFLENPGIFSRRDYPVLTQKITTVREMIRDAAQKNQPELYEKAVEELAQFAQSHLDPYGHFKPHLYFFMGGIHHFLKNEKDALAMFSRAAEFPVKEWQALAHLARGIIYEENLNDLENARKEYQAVLAASPGSPEAEEAETRLKKLKRN